jgi:hypothetical protein
VLPGQYTCKIQNTIGFGLAVVTAGYGGGVYVAGTFTMSGGKISGNTVSSTSSATYGGGVYIKQDASFTMNGGELSGNSASTSSSSNKSYGGGVGAASTGLFTKASGGGVIYGSDGGALQNTADDANRGYAVFIGDNTSSKKRNTTAGTAVELDSTTSGSAGGWEE